MDDEKSRPIVTDLPCAQCSAPCCRRANGVDVHHEWAFPIELAGVRVEWNKAGACPMLDTGTHRCTLQASGKPLPCLTFDCSKDPLFRALHPAVDALLRANGR